MTNSGSTWTIRVWHSNLTTSTLGFEGQLSGAEVYVWGLPVSVSGYGAALYDSSGNLTADLLRRPLTFKARIAMAGGTTSVAMSGVVKPVVIGTPGLYKQTSAKSGTVWTNRIYNGAWRWVPASNLLERDYVQREYFQDDGGIPIITTAANVNALLVEGNGLP